MRDARILCKNFMQEFYARIFDCKTCYLSLVIILSCESNFSDWLAPQYELSWDLQTNTSVRPPDRYKYNKIYYF